MAHLELPDLLAAVNARISEYATGVEYDGVTWEFVCECGAVECREHVTLTLRAYEELQETDAPILAEGHTVSRPTRTRRRSQQLVEDATALTAEARQQLQRAHQAVARRPSEWS